MILDKTQTLAKLITNKQYLRDNTEKIASYKARLEKLRDFINLLEPPVRSLQAIKAKGLDCPQLTQETAKTRAALDDLISKFQSDPAQLTQPQILNVLAREIPNLSIRLKGDLRDIWRQHVKENTPTTNKELLDVMGKLPNFRSTVISLRNLSQEIDQLKEQLPESTAKIDEFENKAAAMIDYWNQLSGGGIPPDVLTFLRESVKLGASLDSLNNEVLSWLADNNMKNYFKIRVQ